MVVGSSPQKLRVALTTTEKSIVTKYDLFLRAKHYLVLEGFNPRIHVLYFCPQLYRYDCDNKLVALAGEEIATLLVQSLDDGAPEKKPWYEPSNKLPNETIFAKPLNRDRASIVPDLREPSVLHAAE